MIRPRRAWPLYEKFLRSVAGLGEGRQARGREQRYDVEHRRAEVLVVGGGSAGREAARRHAAEGRQVVLVEDDPARVDAGEGFEVVTGTALGVYEGGLVPVDAGSVLSATAPAHRRAPRAPSSSRSSSPATTSSASMLPEAVRRLVGRWSLKPGERAVVIAADEGRSTRSRSSSRRAPRSPRSSTCARRACARSPPRAGPGASPSVELDGRKVDCDLLVMSGGRQPAYALLAQAGARVEYDAAARHLRPVDLPDGIEVVGAAAGEVGDAPSRRPHLNGAAKKASASSASART